MEILLDSMETKARIMVVEDEPKIGMGVKKGLEKSGFIADWFGDSQEGLAQLLSPGRAGREPYDLVLLDLMMPNVDGWTITRTVRDAGVMTPILILTARGETEFKTELLSNGADDYMVKPFSFAELVARSTALLRRPNEMLPSRLSVRNLEMDTVERNLRVNGEQTSLTPREFALMEYFMRHPNEMLTRATLMEHAFPRETAGTGSILDVHMKNLRKKVGEDTFSTVRGAGYRLNF